MDIQECEVVTEFTLLLKLFLLGLHVYSYNTHKKILLIEKKLCKCIIWHFKANLIMSKRNFHGYSDM